MQLAREQERWIATYDSDYGELVFKLGLPPPPAILYFRQEPRPATRAAELILRLVPQMQELVGHIVVVEERSMRLHKLPAR